LGAGLCVSVVRTVKYLLLNRPGFTGEFLVQ
jgi:hypothetical protein